MMRVCSVENVRKIEETANGFGMSYSSMMENAGNAVCCEILKRINVTGKNVAVVVGQGNNGGDGYVVARLLENQGAFVRVLTLGESTTDTAMSMKERFGGEITDFDASYLSRAHVIVDAILGIGLKREAEGIYKTAIEAINNSDAYTVAVDIPSGLFADEAKDTLCVKADLTITFIAYKMCQLLYPARENCGETVLSNISLPVSAYENIKTEAEIIPPPVFKKRKRNTHKGSFGTASLVCGSYGMAGAAVLALRACLKSGVGIAKVSVPESIYSIVSACVPEAVCNVYNIDNSVSELSQKALDADALLIGCGLSTGKYQKKIFNEIIKNASKTLIIDADGLNLLSDNIECIKHSGADIVLTPHPGEMARLCKVSVEEIENDRVFYTQKLASMLSCTVVLKGSVTVISDKNKKTYFNLTGNPGMATGGSGDALAGIIVSLAAQGYSGTEAALIGVYIHGAAGDRSSEEKGEISALPSDLIENLPAVFKTFGE